MTKNLRRMHRKRDKDHNTRYMGLSGLVHGLHYLALFSLALPVQFEEDQAVLLVEVFSVLLHVKCPICIPVGVRAVAIQGFVVENNGRYIITWPHPDPVKTSILKDNNTCSPVTKEPQPHLHINKQMADSQLSVSQTFHCNLLSIKDEHILQALN